ncbi:ADP ribosyltransferase [Caulobacteraceae bacterium]
MYPGYISTSRSMETALHSFLGKRAHPGSTPTLLELHLPKGFCALDMSFSSQGGEFEMLVGRRVEFEVTDAFNFDFKGSNDPVLRLVLVPAV